MAVDDADVAELRRMHAEGEQRGDDLSALQSITEVIAFITACARQRGSSEVDAVELVVRAADISKDDLRAAERLLRRLGYTVVCDRLRVLAKTAHKKPAPYCWHMPMRDRMTKPVPRRSDRLN